MQFKVNRIINSFFLVLIRTHISKKPEKTPGELTRMLPYIIIIISRAVRKISYFSSALSRLTSRSFLKSCNSTEREKSDNKNYVKIPFSKFLTVFN